VIVGDRRESPPDTLADLLALTASTCDLTYFSDLGLRGAKIRSDKIVMLADEADLRKKLDHDILIVGSGAANLAARFVNSQACFRFAIDERDRDRALDWEKKLRPIADDGFELTRLVNPDDPVGRERLRDLRNLWSQFAKPGIIDPIDFTGGPRGSKQRARIDHGLVSLCRNPWSETGVAVLAAGRSGPGTATSPKILANPSEFEERPLGGVFKVWIPTEAHWEDRYEKLKFEWETHPYDVEKFKAQLANNDGGLSEWLSPTDVLHLNELFSLLAKRALRP